MNTSCRGKLPGNKEAQRQSKYGARKLRPADVATAAAEHVPSRQRTCIVVLERRARQAVAQARGQPVGDLVSLRCGKWWHGEAATGEVVTATPSSDAATKLAPRLALR